jgi:hypothetical protein
MTRFAKSAAFAIALSLVGGAALAADACKCCKEGEKMECCDKMKDKAAAPKPGETQPAPSEHKH